MGAPGDRNLIDFAANLGLVLHDPLPGRDADTLGFGGGYTKVGRGALDFDRDAHDPSRRMPRPGRIRRCARRRAISRSPTSTRSPAG